MTEEVTEADQKNYISCLTWVKRGVAAAVPDKVELTAVELQNIIKRAHQILRDSNDEEESDEEEGTKKSDKSVAQKDKTKKQNKNEASSSKDEEMEDDSVKANDEFDFEKYDEETENVYANIEDIAVINEGKDPLVTVDDSDDEDSEKEDDVIKSTDNLVIVGHIMDEASIMEVYVYNEEEGSFYCHHHDYLSYIPLCFEWLSFDPAEKEPGNLCAIGNDTPVIEVWDLDIVGGVAPIFKLGQKPNKKRRIKRVGHKDAVLDLAWNTTYHHIMASGSADSTVLLWDIETLKPSTKLTEFEGIVQSIKWHHKDPHLLLTGSMDKKVRLFDCKTMEAKTWETSGEVEKVIWNSSNFYTCFASTDNGYIECIDIRHTKPLWQKKVQEEEIAGLSLSASCPGLLVSSNKDGTVKVWDVMNHLEPQLVFEKQTNLGHIVCLEASCENPYTFVVGGDNKAHNLNVFDFSSIPEVSEVFKNRELIQPAKATKEKNAHEEVMDVTENLGSIALESKKSTGASKKKKKPRHRNLK